MRLDHLNLRVRDARACRAFYEEHLGFELAFEAEDGYFLRNDHGFLLALVPAEDHRPLPDGVHIGFSMPPDEVRDLHERFTAAGLRVTPVEDSRPGEDYITFRCWDPDGTEIELYWDGT